MNTVRTEATVEECVTAEPDIRPLMQTLGRLTQLTFECDDAERSARFWQEVLDLSEPEGDFDWMSLRWAPRAVTQGASDRVFAAAGALRFDLDCRQS